MILSTSQEIISKIKNNEECICPKCKNGVIKFKGKNIETAKFFYCSNEKCNGKLILN